MDNHRVVSLDEWLAARKLLLAKEKEHTRVSDELNRQRRELPWVSVEKEYVFDAPTGKITLAQLFDGRSQLFIKHFMMGPGAAHQCVGCSLEVDHVDGLLEHLQNHDVTYAVVGARRSRRSKPSVNGWAGASLGFHRTTAISTMISTSPSRASRSRPATRSTISNGRRNGQPESKISPAIAFSTRTSQARSSTPIRPMGAAANSFSASTDIWTLCRRGGTKLGRITR